MISAALFLLPFTNEDKESLSLGILSLFCVFCCVSAHLALICCRLDLIDMPKIIMIKRSLFVLSLSLDTPRESGQLIKEQVLFNQSLNVNTALDIFSCLQPFLPKSDYPKNSSPSNFVSKETKEIFY